MPTMDQKWSWRCSLRNLGTWPISAGVVAARAWGGSEIVLEGNQQCLRVDNKCITLSGDEGERQIGELVGAAREAWRPKDGVRNGCGDDSTGLRMPFIPPRWWETAYRGIGSPNNDHA
jgi:hypothetical protein